ncbi:MAG: MFS transporter [Chloroflexi bacterium]|nr:MFS transporter [Chloroflexota bacterium]
MSTSAGSTTTSYDRREQIGWYWYDWANSAFSTTVVSVFLGPYLTGIARSAADATGHVYPLGGWLPIDAAAYFPYLISLSVLLQVLFLPILGAIADFTQRKKDLLFCFAFLGSAATMGMYFLEGSNYQLGGGLFVLANLAFGASIVFYNAFLPDIAPSGDHDRISSHAWALGYLGGGLLLLLNLILFQRAESFGLSGGQAVRISLLSAGAWWALFTLIPLSRLRRRAPVRQLASGERLLTVGFRQLGDTIRSARRYPQTLLFLAAYLLYNDGIQTVIGLASTFGAEELKLEQGTLISGILLVQFVGLFGALALGRVAQRFGARNTVLGSLVVWVGATVFGYVMAAGDATQFYLLATIIALVLGGSQALSRSMFARMIPPGREAEYFSLYEVSERGTSWIGPLLFGLALQFTDSYRVAIVSLMVFFVVGFALLSRVDVARAEAEAHAQ